MGKTWDGGDIAFDPATWRALLQVMKPGAHLVAFGGTRTWHRMAVAIEDAGFELRDTLCWLYGQGFPKSLNVSKQLDKIDATNAAEQWDGFGTALKPSFEPIVLARKKLEGTVAQNVLKWGTGAININGTRIGASGPPSNRWADGAKPFGGGAGHPYAATPPTSGRFPANVVLSHSDTCVEVGESNISGGGHYPATRGRSEIGPSGHSGQSGLESVQIKETVALWACVPYCPVRLLDDSTGTHRSSKGTVKRKSAADTGGNSSASYGAESRQSGAVQVAYGDVGAVSRFYYTSKASRGEREAGLAEAGIPPARSNYQPNDEGDASNLVDRLHGSGSRLNDHATVKPLDLMRWLVRLVTPPTGLVLDPFTGSGTTGCAARLEGMRFVGMELEERSTQIAQARIAHWEKVGATK
jgi:site-specific DNA-methyltransferase (adenine-specific)